MNITRKTFTTGMAALATAAIGGGVRRAAAEDAGDPTTPLAAGQETVFFKNSAMEFSFLTGLGNVYYQGKKNGRRWVIYNGPAEASAIPPGWHGWMHYRTDVPPSQSDYTPREWEIPHQPNLTGTAMAYRPDGSILNPQTRPRVTGDYDAWSPE